MWVFLTSRKEKNHLNYGSCWDRTRAARVECRAMASQAPHSLSHNFGKTSIRPGFCYLESGDDRSNLKPRKKGKNILVFFCSKKIDLYQSNHSIMRYFVIYVVVAAAFVAVVVVYVTVAVGIVADTYGCCCCWCCWGFCCCF